MTWDVHILLEGDVRADVAETLVDRMKALGEVEPTIHLEVVREGSVTRVEPYIRGGSFYAVWSSRKPLRPNIERTTSLLAIACAELSDRVSVLSGTPRNATDSEIGAPISCLEILGKSGALEATRRVSFDGVVFAYEYVVRRYGDQGGANDAIEMVELSVGDAELARRGIAEALGSSSGGFIVQMRRPTFVRFSS